MSSIKILEVLEKGKSGRLNMFDVKYLTKSGKERIWNIFSRKGKEDFEKSFFDKSQLRADGVVIFATHKDTGKLVVLEEYRVGANCKMITLPGGLVEKGEDYATTAIREFKEETNMDLVYVDKSKGLRPRYSCVGLTDETVAVVQGECTGTPTDMQGDNEQGKVLLISPEEAEAILHSTEYEVAGRTEGMLEIFVLMSKLKQLQPQQYKTMSYEEAMRLNLLKRPKGTNFNFMTSDEVEDFLPMLNDVIAERCKNSQWEVQ